MRDHSSKVEGKKDDRPSVLLIICDEHSFRFMGHLSRENGGEDVHTPHLDALAGRSTNFKNAYCAAPICVPSRMSLLTGLEAQKCGAADNGSFLDPELDTLPKALSRTGYTTCLVGKMHFKGSNQFHGFQHRPYGDLCGYGSHQYEHVIPLRDGDLTLGPGDGQVPQDPRFALGSFLRERTRDVGPSKIPESQCVDTIIASESVAFLREQAVKAPETPWFLCASFVRPHFPMTCPERFLSMYPKEKISRPFVPGEGDSFEHPVGAAIRKGFDVGSIDDDEMMRARATYFANVSYIDEILGDLLARLEASNLLEDTIIIYCSDHGEMAGEHGTWWKGGWYEASTRVPLLISTPAQRKGTQPSQELDQPVSLLDIMPTVAGLASAEIGKVSGFDLSAVISGAEPAPRRPVYCDHLNDRWGPGTAFRAVRLGDFKLVYFQDQHPLFFNLAEDPGEQTNLFVSSTGEAAEVRNLLVEHVKATVDFEDALARQAENQDLLKIAYPLVSARYLPNQYMLRSGRVIEADQTVYFQNVVTDHPDQFFADFPAFADNGSSSLGNERDKMEEHI